MTKYLLSHCDVCGDDVKNTLQETTTCYTCQFYVDSTILADYHAVIEATQFLVKVARGRRSNGSVELYAVGSTLV